MGNFFLSCGVVLSAGVTAPHYTRPWSLALSLTSPRGAGRAHRLYDLLKVGAQWFSGFVCLFFMGPRVGKNV